VGKFVKDGDNAPLSHGIGYLRTKDVGLSERDGTSIFHGPGIEFWSKNLVVLVKGVRVPKFVFEKAKALFGYVKNVVSIKVGEQRRPRIHAQRNGFSAGGGQFRPHEFVGSRNECGDVRRDSWGGWEQPG